MRYDPVTFVDSLDQGTIIYAAGGVPSLGEMTNFVSSYFESTNLNKSKIALPPAEVHTVVDLTPGPSQARISDRMSDTVSSPLVVPKSFCVDVPVSSPMLISVG